jgi:hypothetical protein
MSDETFAFACSPGVGYPNIYPITYKVGQGSRYTHGARIRGKISPNENYFRLDFLRPEVAFGRQQNDSQGSFAYDTDSSQSVLILEYHQLAANINAVPCEA